MNEDFKKALEGLTQKKKVHTVTIQGLSIVVSLEKKLEVQKHGEDAYVWTGPMTFALMTKKRSAIKDYYTPNANNDVFWNTEGTEWKIDQE